ncbi:MAG: hypothetical protein WCS01_04205 [bacterium]
MSLKVITQFPGGNAADVEILSGGPIPEVRFASDPCGGPEVMWFHFRLEETAPDPATQTKVRLTWTYFDNVAGAAESPDCVPVYLVPGQTWTRLKKGDETRTPDGRRQLSWSLPHPAPAIEFAFCFPYGPADVDAVLDRSKDYWQAVPIGLSQGGRRLLRLHNAPGSPGGTQPGIYIVARQNAGETPGSWVLDGFLRHWAQIRKGAYVIWAVPLADIDGVVRGHYGKDNFPYDLNRAWGVPPMRHETLAIRHDVERWKARCRPILALDLHAPGACSRDGVYACMSKDPAAPMAAEETKWCNVFQNELQAEFAAPEFKRVAADPARRETPSFSSYLRDEMGVPSLALEIPYSQIAGNVLTQKSYREIGRRLALAILRRHG